jgi:hypothetical protein
MRAIQMVFGGLSFPGECMEDLRYGDAVRVLVVVCVCGGAVETEREPAP